LSADDDDALTMWFRGCYSTRRRRP